MGSEQRQVDPNEQRAFAQQIVRKLRGAGYEALWAGGCVRDQLLELVPKDYDVATSATPDQIRQVFGRRRTLAIGESFGVITVLGGPAAGQIEVATFRTDATYRDGRHPDHVTFTDAQHDAQRRDFTINGLFFDPIADETIDYVHGRADLAAGVIRAIGDPARRFAEDKLRMLRAVRFAATFAFQIEPATLQAIQQSAADITQVSAERIGMEIVRMLLDANRATAIELMSTAGLMAPLLPEVAGLDTAAWQDTRRVLTQLDTQSLPAALAALLYRVGPSSVSGIVRRLRLPNKDVSRARWLLDHLPLVSQAAGTPWPQLQRILIHGGIGELLELQAAVAGWDDPALQLCRDRLTMPQTELDPAPLVDGSDLIAHGLQPGPTFAKLLERIRDAQLEGKLVSREEALAHADQLLADGLDD